MTYARRLAIAAALGYIAVVAVHRWWVNGLNQALHFPGTTVTRAIDKALASFEEIN
jgi:hypothetical protein